MFSIIAPSETIIRQTGTTGPRDSLHACISCNFLHPDVEGMGCSLHGEQARKRFVILSAC